MMSGEFHEIEVAIIKVNRDERYRRNLTASRSLQPTSRNAALSILLRWIATTWCGRGSDASQR
jgi:hypothetical protein